MSSEIANVEALPSGAVISLIERAAEMEAAYQIAKMLAGTAFVPKSYGASPAQIAAAIVTGSELGLSPMASLRSINVIDGTPAITALGLRAIALKAGHEIWTEESTQHRAIVKGRRAGSDKIETSMWDAARATTANLASKDNYKKHPGNMYLARATSDVVRLIAPDAILGLPYSAEEAEDEPFDRSAAEPLKRPTSRAARKPLAEKPPAEEPEPDVANPDSVAIVPLTDEPELDWGEPTPADRGLASP